MSWRPTKDSVELLKHCQRLLKEYSGSITLRQLYYLLVAEGIIEPTEAAYRKVKNLMINARKHGRVSPTTFSYSKSVFDDSLYGDVEGYLNHCYHNYRIPKTYNQPNHVEIWVEREPHKVFFSSIVEPYDIPVYVTGGYSSFSYVFESAKRIEASAERSGSPRVLYFSDLSPASINMFESQVSEISAHLSLTPEEVSAIMLRVGLEPEHVIKYNLPILEVAKSTQKTSLFEDQYSDIFEALGMPRIPVVELEALNPNDLKEIVSNVIFSLLDHKALEEATVLEDRNKKVLKNNIGGK